VPQPSPWRLDSDLATLQLGALKATVRLSQPERGLHDIQIAGRAIASAEVMAPRFGDDEPWPAPIDCFARGGDLVVTYPFTRTRTVRVQIYWRAVPDLAIPGCIAAFDAQISVQTPLLDSRPAMALRSRFEASDALRVLSAGSVPNALGVPWLFRLGQEMSYAQMIHASDVETEDLTKTANLSELAQRLFDGSLEKGVILRARARGAFVETKNDTATVAAIHERFINAPLPLTT